MKLTLTLLATILLCFSNPLTITAQDPFDCVTALQLCDSLEFNIKYGVVMGTVEEDIATLCAINNAENYLEEDYTIWLKYEFESAGDFTFTLAPAGDSTNIENGDIDFVVYQSPNNDCSELESIRCMYSGISAFGTVEQNDRCSGTTGLSRTSTDFFEEPGCANEDDNFLAAVDIEAGDVLFLAVTSFTTVVDFTITHGGSATIACLPTSTEDPLNEQLNEQLSIYPNPATDKFTIEYFGKYQEEYSFELLNANGQLIQNNVFIGQAKIDVTDLPNGVYFVRLYHSNGQPFLRKVMVGR